MKKKDNAAFANGNIGNVASKGVKTSNGLNATTYGSQQKGEENESEFASSKYGFGSKMKNVRRKVMSLTTKGQRGMRLETEAVREDEKSFVKSRVSNKRIET
jgi:hypothetical protein